MNFTEKELKKELEAYAFAWGYSLFGKGSGGLIKTVLQRKGIRGTRALWVECAKAADPKEYLGGALRKITDDLKKDIKIGDRMGNYVYDGSKWKEIDVDQ